MRGFFSLKPCISRAAAGRPPLRGEGKSSFHTEKKRLKRGNIQGCPSSQREPGVRYRSGSISGKGSFRHFCHHLILFAIPSPSFWACPIGLDWLHISLYGRRYRGEERKNRCAIRFKVSLLLWRNSNFYQRRLWRKAILTAWKIGTSAEGKPRRDSAVVDKLLQLRTFRNFVKGERAQVQAVKTFKFLLEPSPDRPTRFTNGSCSNLMAQSPRSPIQSMYRSDDRI